MDANTLDQLDSTHFLANSDALQRADPQCAEMLRNATPPFEIRPSRGRDGAATLTWCDADGRRHWLGRTTMPSIRAEALIDAFNPGSHNILMVGFGHGTAVSRLLSRLMPHQALLVVDDVPWSVSMALHLHDFSAAIDAGRLCLFVGESAWDELRRFLQSNPGYLAPDRILAWPWFDPREVARLTQRLADINKAVARQRAEATATLRSTTPSGEKTDALLVTSNIAQPRVRRLAQMLTAAARAMERPCETFALASPRSVHPLDCEQAVQRLKPALLIPIESVPDVATRADGAAILVLLTGHEQGVQRDKIGLLPPQTLLGVCNSRQREEAIAAGMDAERVLLVPPAACPGLRAAEPLGAKLAVVGDIVDCSPKAAGLNLATHQRLYDKAAENIRRAIAESSQINADAVLSKAEDALKIRLESKDVRAGLVERIHARLQPSLNRIACCEALRNAGIEFDAFGEGWEQADAWTSASRGGWPAPDELPKALTAYRLLIVPFVDEAAAQIAMDAAAAGITIAARASGADRDQADPIALSLPGPILRYKSPQELVALVQRIQTDPGEYQASAGRMAAEISADHTWTRRLAELYTAIESRAT